MVSSVGRHDNPEDRLQVTELPTDEAGTLRLRVSGELDPFTAPILQPVLDRLHDYDELRIDVSGLAFMDSTGLRILALAYQQLDGAGGKLVLERPRDFTVRLLEISGLTNIAIIAED